MSQIGEYIKNRTVFTGTPKENEPEKLEAFYQNLECLFKHII